MPRDTSSLATLSLKDSLGAALTKQGKYAEATALLQDVLETRKSLNQSPSSQGMLCTMNNLAAALQHQGDFTSAEALFRTVMEADRQSLGISHPNTLVSMQNLAVLLAHQDSDQEPDSAKISEARELLQRALELSRSEDSIWSVQSLRIRAEQGKVLLRQKQYVQAEEIAREVLGQLRSLLPLGHPDVAMAMHDLAVALKHLGKVDEAEELLRQKQALLDAHAEDIEVAADGEGMTAMEAGKYQTAERLFRGALATSVE